MMHKTQEHNEPQWKAKVFPRYIQYWQPISQNRNLTILGPRIGVKKISYINVDTIILSRNPSAKVKLSTGSLSSQCSSFTKVYVGTPHPEVISLLMRPIKATFDKGGGDDGEHQLKHAEQILRDGAGKGLKINLHK